MPYPRNLFEALSTNYPNIPMENLAFKGMPTGGIGLSLNILPKATSDVGTPVPSGNVELMGKAGKHAIPSVKIRRKIASPDNVIDERVIELKGVTGIPSPNQIYKVGDTYTNVPTSAEGAVPTGIAWEKSASADVLSNINWKGIAQLFRDKRVTPQFINWATQLILNTLRLANERQRFSAEQAYRQQALDLQKAQAQALIQQRQLQPVKNLSDTYRDLLKQEVEIMKAYNDLGKMANALGKKPEEVEAMKMKLIDLYRTVSARRQAIEAQLQQLGQSVGNQTTTALP